MTTPAAAQYAWKEQSYNLTDKFFNNRSNILNQKARFDLYNTIQDYSKTGCSKLLHQIWQAVRYILTFGNTQWVSTRNELTNVVKNDLRVLIASELPESVKAKIEEAIETYPDDKRDTQEKRDALQIVLSNALAISIVKQIDVKNAVNTLMLALLKVEKAGKKLDNDVLNSGSSKSNLIQSIFKKSADVRANAFVKYLEPQDTAKQKDLLNNANTFSGDKALVSHVEKKIDGKKDD